MKLKLLVLTTFISLQICAQLPNNGLVGYWPFSGNANDLSGSGNNGIVTGATLVPDRFGNTNAAYSFNGTNSTITIPNNAIFDNQNYTIAFWIKFSTSATPGSGGPNVNPGIISRLGNSASVTYDNWVIYEAQSIVAFGSGPGGSSGVSGTPLNINNGQWTHIAFTVSSDSVRCYVNGYKTSSSPKGVNLIFGNYNIVLGRSNANYWKAFQGQLDDLAIWNRSLTDQEVYSCFVNCLGSTIIIYGPATFCQGSNVLLESTQVFASYQWQKNGVNITGATLKTYTANSSGKFRCISNSPCGVDTSNEIQLSMLSNASNQVQVTGATAFCIGDSVVLNSSNSNVGYSYQWYRNNVAINGATANTYIGKTPGTYKVVSKNNANNCSRISSNSAIVSVTCRTSNKEAFVGNVEVSRDILLYPNPNEGSFTLEIINEDLEEGVASYQVININGQVIYSGKATLSDGTLRQEINLDRHYSPGLYFVKVMLNGREMSQKVMLR